MASYQLRITTPKPVKSAIVVGKVLEYIYLGSQPKKQVGERIKNIY